jgi:DNA invertase Pin-like site-specific DNA recombinase
MTTERNAILALFVIILAGLLAAVDALAAHGAGLLLVAKRDRLARDVMAAALVERLAERVGARIVSAAGEGTDGAADDPAALLMRRMVDAFAEYERAIIRARTRAALAVKRERGERTGSIPYGSRLAADGRMLEPDTAERAIVAAAHDLRAEGLSLRAVGAALTARGMLPRSGGAWNPKTVRALLGEAAA